MSKINDILAKLMSLNPDDLCEAEVYVAVRRDTGEVLAAGTTEVMAMECAIQAYNNQIQVASYQQEKENEANARLLVSLVKVPLW